MGTPKRTSILLDFRTALATISISNGYKTGVTTLEDGIESFDCVSEAQRPYVGWSIGAPEIPTPDAYNSLTWKIPITVVGYIYVADQTDWEARSTAINNLMDDIIAVVNVDPSRDNYAIDTRMNGFMTNECDLCAKNDGWCQVDMEIEYERTVESS